ncbi:MAG TPA: hypothetical protein PL074_09010, partial [Thermoflexales bacterium]|nr:hypothetical protein [Thermoflexales bacterium]
GVLTMGDEFWEERGFGRAIKCVLIKTQIKQQRLFARPCANFNAETRRRVTAGMRRSIKPRNSFGI